jgi:PAS domain S-box-containing protein
MSATPDNSLADPEQIIADLQRQLAVSDAERDEERAQKAALSQLFELISSSPGDLGLVFETLLGTGARLCKAEQAVITLRNPQDGLYHYRASFGYGRDFRDLLIRNPVAPGRASLIGRTALEGRVVHIEDAATDPEYKWAEALRLGRWHTGLGVPLLRDGAVVGTLVLTRRHIERFTDKQIELIKTFADQAVIAIENARLLGELRESEERYGLVSEAVAEGIYEWDVEHNSLWASSRLIGIFGLQGRNLTAADWNDLVHPEDFPKYRTALRDCFKSITARLDCEYRIRHSDGQYRWIEDRGVPVRNASGRAVRLVGAVSDISTRKEADEALREALEQQTATAEVLQVINSSPGDLAPVFEAMLEKALRLCEAAFGLLIIWDGEQFHRVAFRGVPPELIEAMRQPLKPVAGGFADRLVRGERVIAVADLLEAGGQPIGPGAQLLVRFGARSYLGIALRRDEALLGAIVIYRREVRPFSDQQIALLENFAAQAIIAMENARLINETREALEQQTATAEVLQVINSSPGDLAPVFDTMLERATRLSDAAFGIMQVYDGERFRTVATRRMPPALAEFLLLTPRQPTPHSAVSRILAGEDFVHFDDMRSEPAYLSGDPRQQAFATLGGTRTYVAVALRKDDRLLGTIATYRQEVRPFSEKQIALLQNFAAQAVIAMENARLITETREALEQQTATAEVLQVINSSPGDLAPVFEVILEKAHSLCGAAQGALVTKDGEDFRAVATHGLPEPFVRLLRQPRRGGGPREALLRGDQFVQISDLADRSSPHYNLISKAAVELACLRTALFVPLRRDSILFGYITAYHQDVRLFSKKEISLLQNVSAI